MSEAQPISEDEKSRGSKPVSRRDFLGWILRGGLLATLGGMVFPAILYLLPITRRGPSSGLTEIGNVEDIPVWGSKKIVLSGSVMLVVRTPNEFKAFAAICTHLGCVVDWNEKKREIVCPCHAGFFDVNGQVISGPPPRPLPVHQVMVVGDKLFVKV